MSWENTAGVVQYGQTGRLLQFTLLRQGSYCSANKSDFLVEQQYLCQHVRSFLIAVKVCTLFKFCMEKLISWCKVHLVLTIKKLLKSSFCFTVRLTTRSCYFLQVQYMQYQGDQISELSSWAWNSSNNDQSCTQKTVCFSQESDCWVSSEWHSFVFCD